MYYFERFQKLKLPLYTWNFSELYNEYAYRNLDAETLDYVNTLWEELKIA